MRRTMTFVSLLFAAAAVVAQTAPALAPPTPSPAGQAHALKDITFTSKVPAQTIQGFGNAPAEIGRYDTLQITVPTSFAADSARQFALAGPVGASLVDEINAFTELASALRGYTNAIAAAAAKSPGEDISQDPVVVEARQPLIQSLETFRNKVKPLDRPRFDAVSHAFGSGQGYAGVAQVLQQEIDDLNTRLTAQIKGAARLGITASIVPPESDTRPLHLPGYDTNTEAAVAATPNYIPVVDDRTRAEAQAAQTLADTAKQLGQIGPELKKSIQQLQTTLDDLRKQLKTDVLEQQLAQLEQDLKTTAAADLGDLTKEVTAALALVRALNSTNLTLTGTTDADKLLNLATSLTATANGLISAATSLPTLLPKLATDLEAAVKKHAQLAVTQTVALIKTTAADFVAKQTFFTSFAGNLKLLGNQFSANSQAALSAERLESTAREIAGTADLNTSLNLSLIAGDVHVQDRIVVKAALYRVNSADNTLKSIDDGQQVFIVERYGFYPDSVRGGLIFVQPRSKVDRNISYQPVPALGYYWRFGKENSPGWNAASPSFGFTMAMLDFSDKNDLEIGFAAGVSLFRNLIWTGYGRNLQVRANYFYVGTNPLLLGKMILNRSTTP